MRIAVIAEKIRRRETPIYNFLYNIAKAVRGFELPYVPGIHDVLYHERSLRVNLWRSLWRVFYYQPLFRSRCHTCGKGLYIINSGQGLPVIEGDLKIDVGNNVSIYDRSTFGALTIGSNPRLIIGENTQIASSVAILVGNRVSIGNNCIISCTMIADNPGHNLDYRKRYLKLEKEKIEKINIGDHVWAATQSIIIGRVNVGTGAIISPRAVVRKNVPPFCIVNGDPARVIRKLPIPDEIRANIKPAEYEEYLQVELKN